MAEGHSGEKVQGRIARFPRGLRSASSAPVGGRLRPASLLYIRKEAVREHVFDGLWQELREHVER